MINECWTCGQIKEVFQHPFDDDSLTCKECFDDECQDAVENLPE